MDHPYVDAILALLVPWLPEDPKTQWALRHEAAAIGMAVGRAADGDHGEGSQCDEWSYGWSCCLMMTVMVTDGRMNMVLIMMVI